MGKPGKRNRKLVAGSKSGKMKPGSSSNGDKHKYSVEQLMEKVHEYMELANFKLALTFCDRALEQEPDSVHTLEMKGTIQLESGNIEDAVTLFEKCIELSPDVGHTKYMYLGQLSQSDAAISYYNKGIEIMTKELQTSPDTAQCTIGDISSAHCACAEIYMTDECFAEDAEALCRQHLDKSIELDNKNAEALQMLASFYLSKEDTQNAKEAIQGSVNLWLPQLKETLKPTAADNLVEAPEFPLSSRINAAKILIEVEDYQLAEEVLKVLVEEEEELADVWYLLGWLNYLQGEDYRENAQLYLTKTKVVVQQYGCQDEGIVEHTDALLKEIGPGNVDESSVHHITHNFDDDSGGEDSADGDEEMEVDQHANGK